MELDEKSRLNEIIQLGDELNTLQDMDILLEKILLEARKFVNADAGTIFICNGKSLDFSKSQSETLQKKLPPGQKSPYLSYKMPINRSSIAGYVAATGEILNISNVYLIRNKPYKFKSFYDKENNYKTQSMLTIPMKNNLGSVIGVLQVINAKNNAGKIIPFNESDKPYIQHFANTASIVLQRAQMTRALLLRMTSMAELRDPKETGAHVNRVASYAVEIYEKRAHTRNLNTAEIDRNRDALRMAAMLHDVGKVAISDLILKKPGKLNKLEFKIMKTHTYLGARLLGDRQSHFDEIAATAALMHHENWDGTGYPGYIDINTEKIIKKGHPKKNQIPIYGRVVALADVFDALSSKRVYKDAWDMDDVIKEIRKMSGKKFDPELVEIFLDSIELFESIKRAYPDAD